MTNDIDPFDLFPAPEPEPRPKTARTDMPYTIRTIVDQCGGMGLSGAFVYVGAERFVYRHPPEYDGNWDGECRSSFRSEVTRDGQINYDVGLSFRVNGKRGQRWTMLIVYEPDDTYSIYLWRPGRPSEQERGIFGVALDQRNDVYCDTLKEVVERMYDRGIQHHCDGFIPL